MKTINQQYLRAKHPEIAGGRDLVIQVARPQFVCSVCLFNRSSKGEENRLNLLDSLNNPYSFAKANGYRIYTIIVGTMLPDEEQTAGWNELMHQTLQEMAMFYANQMTEGMKKQYADEE